MKNVGQVIRKFRIAKGLTIEQLAFRTGVTSTHMGCIERGKRENITVDTLGKISEAFDQKPYQVLAVTEYCDELEDSCPLKGMLIECHRCRKTGREAFDCCRRSCMRVSQELLNIGNAAQLLDDLRQAQESEKTPDESA